MNQIDKKFESLMKEIKNLSEEELESKMKEKYMQVPEVTRKSIEDFFEKFSYWGSLHGNREDFIEIKNACHELKENWNNFQKLYDCLEDYRSKYILYAILNNWYCYDFQNLKSAMEQIYPHYLDLDIIPSCKDEIFVDLGAYTGDTIEEFLKMHGENSFKKIYAYEMSPDSIEILKKKTHAFPNLIVRECAVSDISGRGSLTENQESASANVLKNGDDFPVTTLDEDIKEKITMLKMDIEGSETKALLGAKNHIVKEKPKMMISVYHGFHDLTSIWQILKEWNSDYKFFLRYYGGPIFPTEIVLYAI